MPSDLVLPDRKHNRLQGYDYSTPGVYFVTICTHLREPILATIDLGQVRLKKCGEFCLAEWESLPRRFNSLSLDEFVIMPNHLHGILVTEDLSDKASLSKVIGTFKSLVAHKYSVWHREQTGTGPGKIWQRSYHDHVIRNDRALHAIRDYIHHNPLNWEKDPDNIQR